MNWWIWFLIGAVFNFLMHVRSPILLMQWLQAEYKFQGAFTALLIGALVYGTLLWLFFNVLLGW